LNNDFSYTKFPVNKINIEFFKKYIEIFLFNYSFYSHPEIGKFQGVTKAKSGHVPSKVKGDNKNKLIIFILPFIECSSFSQPNIIIRIVSCWGIGQKPFTLETSELLNS
jgi:hypothetical protein